MNDLFKIMSENVFELAQFINQTKAKSGYFESGIKEGARKFLSNIYIKIMSEEIKKQKSLIKKEIYSISEKKYLLSHVISEAALECIRRNDIKNKLIFEHVVPKEYYQNEIFDHIQDFENPRQIEDILKNYWIIATITKGEDPVKKTFKRFSIEMYRKNPFLRYSSNPKIKFIKNDLLSKVPNYNKLNIPSENISEKSNRFSFYQLNS